jgi:hypothetical protein
MRRKRSRALLVLELQNDYSKSEQKNGCLLHGEVLGLIYSGNYLSMVVKA